MLGWSTSFHGFLVLKGVVHESGNSCFEGGSTRIWKFMFGKGDPFNLGLASKPLFWRQQVNCL